MFNALSAVFVHRMSIYSIFAPSMSAFVNLVESVLVEIQSIVLKIRFYERFKEFAVLFPFPHSKIHSDVRIFGHKSQRIANVQVIEQQTCRIFLPRIKVIIKVLRQPYV